MGLGGLRVQSYLGEPLRAQVDLIELNGAYEASLKVRLANPEEYKKGGYAYPYDKKYKFEVLNEDGKHPYVHISSLLPIEDPFLNLMMEVDAPTGRIIKTFTFLIDPSPELYRSHDIAHVIATPSASMNNKPVTQPRTAVVPVIQAPVISDSAPARIPSTRRRKVSKPRLSAGVHRLNTSTPSSRYVVPLAADGQISGKLSLSLSTALSISSSDPSLPLSPTESNDALREELIAKEKTLQELNEQLAEMQGLIKGLQIKLSMTAGSAVAESGMKAGYGAGGAEVGASAVAQVAVVPVAVAKTVVAAVPVSTWDTLLQSLKSHNKKLLASLAIILFGAMGYYIWRKRKLGSGWIAGGLFDDLASSTVEQHPKPSASTLAPAPVAADAETNKVSTKKLAVGEQSMKVPAFKVQKTPPALPPEYDLLEEANIYLRFGHDKLAEEVLYDALKINPKNPDIYMTLLGIFDTRTDASGFERLAKEFKTMADSENWKKVVTMGRQLDGSNALYDQ